jgi:hypothetical protein
VTTGVVDRFATARAVADAVLYEGYVLYPYRASSPKNQVRWQFGVLVPRAFSEADGSERWSLRTETLVEPAADCSLVVRIRCLQVRARAIEAGGADGGRYRPVPSLTVDDETHVAWEEAIDQVVDLPPLPLASLTTTAYRQTFRFEAGEDVEPILSAGGAVAGRLIRRCRAIDGLVQVSARRAAGTDSLVTVAVEVQNMTALPRMVTRRHEIIDRSLVAVHAMLAVDHGRFVSLLDPAENARLAAADCGNDGVFPVLIGSDDVVLASPIILYDHPEVAPESPGDLYDATEIDEILALRVLTLTDEEKHEARNTDPRAAAIIDRCDDMPPEIWERLHGAMRSVGSAGDPFPVLSTPGADGPPSAPWWDPATDASIDPWTDSVVVAGVPVTQGTAVRLRPSHRADAQDLFVDGLRATVAGVFRDVDGGEHIAVTVDDDPAVDELVWQGRFLYFHPDEVEPLPNGSSQR